MDNISDPNTIESYAIAYERDSLDPSTGVEVVEIFDAGDQIILSGGGKYLENTEEILESENPSRKASSKALKHNLVESWEAAKSSLTA